MRHPLNQLQNRVRVGVTGQMWYSLLYCLSPHAPSGITERHWPAPPFASTDDSPSVTAQCCSASRTSLPKPVYEESGRVFRAPHADGWTPPPNCPTANVFSEGCTDSELRPCAVELTQGMHQKGRDLRGGGQRRLHGRLEEVAKAVGGGYCRLQMPLGER